MSSNVEIHVAQRPAAYAFAIEMLSRAANLRSNTALHRSSCCHELWLHQRPVCLLDVEGGKCTVL